MATEILMPRQGNTVESCVILEWKKSVGDAVAAGEPICEVETDKATFEVEAPDSGTLIAVLFGEGDDVPVLTAIAYVGAEGEEVPAASAAIAQADSGPAKSVQEDVPVSSTGGAAAGAATRAPLSPTAETPAQRSLSDSSNEKQRISPRAKRYAAEHGINPVGLTGSGPLGRVLERDVQAAAKLTPAAASLAASGATSGAASGIGGRIAAIDMGSSVMDAGAVSAEPTEIPVKGVRKIVAERMLTSLNTTAQLTLNTSADARAILAYRKKLKNSPEEYGLNGITLNDIVHFALLSVLQRFPELNRHFLGDHMLDFPSVDLAFAVDTDRGLMVPVMRSAERLSLKDLAGEAKRLSTGCIDGTVAPDELSGGTFTVTNLGVLGIESFTPVLNPPQVAILGVCAIQPKPVLTDNGAEFIPHIGLSLTFDHQGVDGAPAGRFLAAVSAAIADFDLVLAG